jgi:hypothetical protein
MKSSNNSKSEEEQKKENNFVNGLIGESGNSFNDNLVTRMYTSNQLKPSIEESRSAPIMHVFFSDQILPAIASGLFKKDELSKRKECLVEKEHKIDAEFSEQGVRDNVKLSIGKFIDAINLGSGESIEKHGINNKKIEEYKNLSDENKGKLKIAFTKSIDVFFKFCIEENKETIQEITINKIINNVKTYNLINNDDDKQALKDKLNKYQDFFDLNKTNYKEKSKIAMGDFGSINAKDLDGISNQILSVFSSDEQKQQILKDAINERTDKISFVSEEIKSQIKNDIKDIYSIKLKDIDHAKLNDFDKKLDEILNKEGNINDQTKKGLASRIIESVTEFLVNFFKSREEIDRNKAEKNKIEQLVASIGEDVKNSIKNISSEKLKPKTNLEKAKENSGKIDAINTR